MDLRLGGWNLEFGICRGKEKKKNVSGRQNCQRT